MRVEEGSPAVPASEASEGGLSPIVFGVLAGAACAAVVAFVRTPWFALSPAVGPRGRWLSQVGLAGFAAALLLGWLVAAMAWQALGQTDWNEHSPLARGVLVSALSMSAQLAALVGLAAWHERAQGVHAPGAHAPGAPTAAPTTLGESGALLGAVNLLGWPVLIVASSVALMVQQMFEVQAPRLGHSTLAAMQQAGTSDPWWWGAAFVAVVLAPASEEWLYRRYLQQGLRGVLRGRWAAIAAASCTFAALHWSALPEGSRVPGLVTLALLGVMLGYLYERTGRLAAPIAMHAIFNAVNLARL